MATRRKAAPFILKLGGLTHGTGQFFGQTVHNLTTEFRELQDIENLKKFADGDPETFLEYWKEREKTVKGKLKDQLAAFAERAKKRVKRLTEDAAALASYARTNNHQAYMDHLLKRLDEETDPALISRLGTQINELRSRVFSSSGGSGAIGGGVSQEAFTSARDEWGETRMKYEAIIKSRPLTSMEFGQLEESAKKYAGVLKAIIFSTDATQSRKDTMNSQYLLKDGPNTEFLESVETRSDAKLLSKLKNDADFASLIAPLIQAKKFGEVARMYAERQRNLTVLAPQALGVGGADAIGNWLKDSDVQASRWASEATKESAKRAPAQEEKLENWYSSYWSALTQAHEDDASIPVPKEYAVWKRQLEHSANAEQFGNDVGIPYTNATFDELKQLVKGGVAYDSATNSYSGDPDAVANVREADRAIKIAMDTPGSDFEIYKKAGLDDPISVQMVRAGTLTPAVAQSMISMSAGENARDKRAKEAMPASEAAAPPSPAIPAEGQPDLRPGAAQYESNIGGQRPTSPSVQSTDITPATYDSVVQGVDTYLTEYDFGDLPDWTPPEETPVADFDSLFPFEESVPQVTQPSVDMQAPQDAGEHARDARLAGR